MRICEICLRDRQLCPLLACNEVKDVFASARGGEQYRVLKIIIDDGKRRPTIQRVEKSKLNSCTAERCTARVCFPEQLTLGSSKKASKKWDQEFDAFVQPMLEDDTPCYILYRLDSTNNQGYEWLFLAFTPDKSSVRRSARPRLDLMNSFASLVALVPVCFG